MAKANSGPLSGKIFVFGIGVLYLGVVGLGVGLYYDYLIAIFLGLALIAFGITIYTIASVKNSQRQMQAMANLVFHEKIAIIQSYLGKQHEQIEHDRLAAGEFEKWSLQT